MKFEISRFQQQKEEIDRVGERKEDRNKGRRKERRKASTRAENSRRILISRFTYHTIVNAIYFSLSYPFLHNFGH